LAVCVVVSLYFVFFFVFFLGEEGLRWFYAWRGF
jgi:hypothetical protein